MEPLAHTQLALLRRQLEQRRDELEAAATPEPGAGGGALPVSEIEFSPADMATNRLLNDLALEVAGKHWQQLSLIRAALNKMAEGSYGLCEACGNDIGYARLQARPEAPLCFACQARAERR